MEKTLWKNLYAILLKYRWPLFRAVLMIVVANGLLLLIPLIFRLAVIQIDPHVVSRLSLETAVQDNKVMQDFELELLRTGADHSQTVKAAPVRSDYGSKDSVNLLSSNAVSRLNAEAIDSFLQFIFGKQIPPVYPWAALLLILSLTAAIFKYGTRYAFLSISRNAERDLRSKIFARIQEQSMHFYDRHGIGELLSRLTNDISIYRDVIGPGLMYPLFFITIVFPGLVILFFLSASLAAISLIPLFAIPFLNYMMRKRIHKTSHLTQKGLADLSNQAQEHYSGIRVIKGYGIESRMVELFGQLGRKMIKINMKLGIYQGFLFSFFTALTKIITVIIVMTAGVILSRGMANLNAADFITFMWIQSYIFFPILMIAWLMPIYARGCASYERLLEIYEEPIEVKNGQTIQENIPQKADIEFNSLIFSYPDTSKPILNSISAYIKSGTFLGITGAVGSGKTTIFRLLNREYEIPRGMLRIGGYDIKDYPLDSIGKEIVTVEQLPFLFSRTIAENVGFGKEEACPEEIERVSKYADLHETVLDFPEQYETMVGERGLTLSGGQKQRVAMARAFLVNRSILLLDDIFSAVDAETERRIFKAIQTNFKGKTVLFVTHRLSILEEMDRVIYMEKGHIAEDGTPEALKRKNGKYAALLELQNLSGN